MKTFYIATDKALAIARQHDGEWAVDARLTGLATQCLAVEDQQPEEVYCGTFGQGLWHSNDTGRTWVRNLITTLLTYVIHTFWTKNLARLTIAA